LFFKAKYYLSTPYYQGLNDLMITLRLKQLVFNNNVNTLIFRVNRNFFTYLIIKSYITSTNKKSSVACLITCNQFYVACW
jgi:hypothetical protein